MTAVIGRSRLVALFNWSGVEYLTWLDSFIMPEPVFLYTLRYIVGFGLDEMVVPTNPKATIYRNFPANTGNSPDDVSMLAHRLRRWPNIEEALGECPGWLYENADPTNLRR